MTPLTFIAGKLFSAPINTDAQLGQFMNSSYTTNACLECSK